MNANDIIPVVACIFAYLLLVSVMDHVDDLGNERCYDNGYEYKQDHGIGGDYECCNFTDGMEVCVSAAYLRSIKSEMK